MEQVGEYRLAASRIEIWHALNDPDVLSQCIDGCQAIEKISDEAFEARVKAKIGPVSATFNTDIQIADVNAPESYTLTVSAKGGAAGFGKGVAKVKLSEQGEETVLVYSVEANVGGKLAQVGSRLIDAAARKMADDFFTRFRGVVAPEQILAEEVVKEYEPSGRWLVWIVVFLILALALGLAL